MSDPISSLNLGLLLVSLCSAVCLDIFDIYFN